MGGCPKGEEDAEKDRDKGDGVFEAGAIVDGLWVLIYEEEAGYEDR